MIYRFDQLKDYFQNRHVEKPPSRKTAIYTSVFAIVSVASSFHSGRQRVSGGRSLMMSPVLHSILFLSVSSLVSLSGQIT